MRRIAVIVLALGSAGCFRLGYSGDGGAANRDAAPEDANPPAEGGRGGTGAGAGAGGSGTGGNAGMDAADSGTRDDASIADEDGGMETEPPTDAGTDAGVIEVPNDAGAADGGVVVSPLCPERPGVAFCDGFEDPDLTRWSYPVLDNGTLTRVTTRARSGVASLLATTGPPAEGTQARWATKVLANQMSGDAWMRFYNWVPNSVTVTRHFSVGVMSEIVPPYQGFELRLLPSLVDINATNGIFAGAVSFPRDQWVCVELHVFIDPIAGFYEAYLDGDPVVRSPAVDTVPADGFSVAEVGVHYADPQQGPVEVYVDDVAVGASRIGCD